MVYHSTSHVYCAVKGCESSGRLVAEEGVQLSFFRFPTKDRSRCMDWVLACGRDAELQDLTDKKLRERRICSSHFAAEDFMNPQLKHRLMPQAVPKTVYNTPHQEDEDMKSETGAAVVNIVIQEARDDICMDIAEVQQIVEVDPTGVQVPKVTRVDRGTQTIPKKKTDAQKIRDLRLLLKQKNSRIRYLEDKCEVIKMRKTSFCNPDNAMIAMSDYITGDPFQLFCMQIRHRKATPYSEAEKKMALDYFRQDPRSYHFWRSKGFHFPSKTVIRRWLKESDPLALDREDIKLSQNELECTLTLGAMYTLQECPPDES